MTFFTAVSTTRVVFFVNSVEINFKIFSCLSKSAVWSARRTSSNLTSGARDYGVSICARIISWPPTLLIELLDNQATDLGVQILLHFSDLLREVGCQCFAIVLDSSCDCIYWSTTRACFPALLRDFLCLALAISLLRWSRLGCCDLAHWHLLVIRGHVLQGWGAGALVRAETRHGGLDLLKVRLGEPA